jgi:hypothetical protein
MLDRTGYEHTVDGQCGRMGSTVESVGETLMAHFDLLIRHGMLFRRLRRAHFGTT